MENPGKMARQLPGALCLGLLAAFVAHIAVYGAGHTMGGSFGEALRLLAVTTTIAAAIAWLAMGWASRGRLCDGTVIAARMERLFPSVPAITVAAVGWFALAESIEDSHAGASIAILAGSLLLASFFVGKIARLALRAVSATVFGTQRRRFHPRLPIWAAIERISVPVYRMAVERHHLARPPPVGMRA